MGTHASDAHRWAGPGLSLGSGLGIFIGLLGWGAAGLALGAVFGAAAGVVVGAAADALHVTRRH